WHQTAVPMEEPCLVRVTLPLGKRGWPPGERRAKRQRGAYSRHNGGRGVYFDDPDGHFLEVMTQPYVLNG
ncbi:VOC family protein, partial [Burkholderia cenocepacia]|nr:VOC family protein [Burkholderia cenocepacia]